MKIDFRAIAAEVQENVRRRRACPQHVFPQIDEHRFGARLTCQRCGCWMNASDVTHYVAGFRAAGGDPDNVWPGYVASQRSST